MQQPATSVSKAQLSLSVLIAFPRFSTDSTFFSAPDRRANSGEDQNLSRRPLVSEGVRQFTLILGPGGPGKGGHPPPPPPPPPNSPSRRKTILPFRAGKSHPRDATEPLVCRSYVRFSVTLYAIVVTGWRR